MTTTATHETITVATTTFRFPLLPDDAAPEAIAGHTKRRREILAAAAKVGKFRIRKPPRATNTTPPPGTGEFSPKRGEPGSVFYLHDGREVEVWASASNRDLWAIDRETGDVDRVSKYQWLPEFRPAPLLDTGSTQFAMFTAPDTVPPADRPTPARVRAPRRRRPRAVQLPLIAAA